VLNPDLDTARLAGEFARERRLQIPAILTGDAAERIHQCLSNDVPWNFACRLDGRDQLHTPEQLAALSPEARFQMGQRIFEQARAGFAFGFMSFPMVENYRSQRVKGLFLDRVIEALASPEFIGFARAVAGDASINKVDAQATRYTAGHFLTLHDDAQYDGAERRLAYVLNFSKDWRAEWGGLLQFLDGGGKVVESFVPRFNSLSLFAVPTPHIVSYVAPYAAAPRLSITGWFTV
jgi:SM-20-related protein